MPTSDRFFWLKKWIDVALQWIPSHCDITGNKFTDSLANVWSNLPEPDPPASCHSIKRIITARFNTSYHKTITNITSGMIWNSLRDSSISYEFPWLVSIANFRTLTGQDYLRKQFYRFGLADFPRCPLCLTDSDMSGDRSLELMSWTWIKSMSVN